MHPAHPGAAEWARARILSLPTAARELYRDRYGALAASSLEQARRLGTHRALIDVAQAWPLTDAAREAWRTLGDIELERGNPRQALLAWRRAARTNAALGGDADDLGLAPRESMALAMLGVRLDADAPELRSSAIANALRTQDAARARGPLPSRDAVPWTRQLDLKPFDGRYYTPALFPILSGDDVLVSSSLRLYCIDAFTGETRWEAGPPSGWAHLSETSQRALFEGINRQQVMIRPAVGGRLAITPLQLPYSVLPNQNFQGIEVMKAIPQRRLFAFDLETGETVWSHAPTLVWNESGPGFQPTGFQSFAQRMLVGGPPVIEGSRVLVPCYTLEGRIDFHIACYELATGDLLWSTGVVSGQRSRNMFGRAMEEFGATPVVVAGDRVVVQTELGTIAALDLFTGRILWESLYPQVALPQTIGFRTLTRPQVWRLSPPVVTGRVVLCTPSDSDSIAAFDLTDGRVLWTYSAASLSRLGGDARGASFNLLMGADRDTIYLGGSQIAALRKPGGLANPLPPFNLVWTSDPIESSRYSRQNHRPLLCDESILVPLSNGRVVLERRDGRERRSLSAKWQSSHAGNPLVQGGLLFTLGAKGLTGFFDWDLLLERQRKRMADAPRDTQVALATAALYARRAEATLEEGESFASLTFLKSAREILDPLRAELEDQADPRNADLVRVADELHRVLRAEARALERQGHRAGALAALDRARELARSRVEVRDTLLQQERNLRATPQRTEHLAVLAELERTCADLPLSSEAGPDSLLPIDVTATAGADDAPPVGLWVLLTRANAQRRVGRTVEAYEDWHAVIARYGDETLGAAGPSASGFARSEIAAALATPSGKKAYEGFERRAAELYAAALEGRSRERLAEVSQLYPHSQAARDADGTRLDWAYQDSDADTVARIVYEAPGGPSDRGLLRLGRVLGRLGNRELERHLLSSMGRRDPRGRSDLDEHGGRSFEELARELDAAIEPLVPPAPTFDANVTFPPLEIGSYEFVGRLVTRTEEGDPAETHVYLVRDERGRMRHGRGVDRVEAFSSVDERRPKWRVFLQDPVLGAQLCAISRDRILLGGERVLQALDPDGRTAWRRSTGDLPITSVQTHQGIVVATIGGTVPTRVLAYDAHSGVTLWAHELGTRHGWRPPVFGDGVAVFFSKPYGKAALARTIDLFRGAVRSEIELGILVSDGLLEHSAWVEDERLFVPHFTPRLGGSSRVAAYDLRTGAEAWSRVLPEDEGFRYVVRHADETYLVTISDSLGVSGGVYAFETSYGGLTRILSLSAGEEPMGLLASGLTVLPTPELLTYTPPAAPSQPMDVCLLNLETHARWTAPLRHVREGDRDLDGTRPLPLPAIGADTVAVAYMLHSPASQQRGAARLVFLSRRDGITRDTITLQTDFGQADSLELRPLGDALFVVGRGIRTPGWRMQILEKAR